MLTLADKVGGVQKDADLIYVWFLMQRANYPKRIRISRLPP